MDFDDILVEIGEFGRYQITNYLLICLPVMFAAANSLSYVFTAGKPNYRCHVAECDDLNNPDLNAQWIHNALPGRVDSAGVFVPENCYMYRIWESEANSTCPAEMFDRGSKTRCSQWVYDLNDQTIVQRWELTCSENSWKLAFVGTMHFAGLVVGTALSGFLADRFGRKLLFIICIIFMAVTGILQGVAWDYNSFLAFAFLNAIGTSGVYPLAFIIGVEMVGPRKREMTSIVLNYFYAIGEALVGLLAWLCGDWQALQFVLSAPPLIFILYYWFVPESVRWLLAKNKHKRAGKIIKRAAKINKKELSEGLLANLNKSTTSCGGNFSNDSLSIANNNIYDAVKAVLKSRVLLARYALLLYIWGVNAFVFYGLSLNSTNLSGNKYLNFALVCLIEIPGYSLAWISLHKFGRRWSLAGSMFLCAVTCIAGGFVTTNLTWLIVTLFLIGKLGITSSFAVIYTYTAEMMPTVIRSGGVGCMSTFARFGAMLAPFVPLLGTYLEYLPLLLFGSVAFSAGLLILILPETFHQKLPDTVEEAELIGQKLDLDEVKT